MDKNIVVDKIFLPHPQICIFHLTFSYVLFKYNPQFNFNQLVLYKFDIF